MVAGLCRRTCLFVLRLSFVLEFYDNSSREFIIVGERFVLRALALAHVAGLPYFFLVLFLVVLPSL